MNVNTKFLLHIVISSNVAQSKVDTPATNTTRYDTVVRSATFPRQAIKQRASVTYHTDKDRRAIEVDQSEEAMTLLENLH